LSYSQPLPGKPSQSLNPGAHPTILQTPAVQLPDPFAGAQMAPQLPQLLGSVGKPVLSYSQPLPGKPSQSLKPGAQVPTAQVPPLQLPVACAGEHARPHPPQFAGSVLVFTSQPGWPSQSACPAVQVFITHALARQMSPPVQVMPQPLQLRESVGNQLSLYSQPSTARPLQLLKPVVQLAMLHVPAEHCAFAFWGAHNLRQPPQLATSV
jgi:hypothetical protein